MKLKIAAPTRIDLAGGTLDIYPLYLFQGGGLTVNMAIDLESTVELETRQDSRFVIHSKDMHCSADIENLESIRPEGNLDLILRAIRFFRPQTGLNITTCCTVPKGSGLAASSSLLVALMYGLMRLCGEKTDAHKFIDWCANVEAENLGIPTGKQDYYAAYFGGLSAIRFDARGITHSHIPLPIDRGSLEDYIVLSFTGISHFSGTNNWNMMKRCIDKTDNTKEHLENIGQTAVKMEAALQSYDPQQVAAILQEEWQNRKQLAEGVSNQRIETMIAASEKAGAMASKICGAGGGGCMVTFCPPQQKKAVTKALEETGAQILHFKITDKGVRELQN